MRRPAACVWLGAAVLAAAGCGGSSQRRLPLGRWLSYDAPRRTATVYARAGYDGVYAGFNFNGYGKGAVLVRIPRGWSVIVRCENDSAEERHSCAVVRGVGATAPAFAGASSPDPEKGIAPSRADTFTFVASRIGVYRLASLVPQQEQGGMWDVLQIVPGGRPGVQLLRH